MAAENSNLAEFTLKLSQFKGDGTKLKLKFVRTYFESICPKNPANYLVYCFEDNALVYNGKHILGTKISSLETMKNKSMTRY